MENKISDLGFEWISANLDQISLYVPNFALLCLSIFAKRVPWMNGRKRLNIFAFVFHLFSPFSGFGLTGYMLVYISDFVLMQYNRKGRHLFCVMIFEIEWKCRIAGRRLMSIIYIRWFCIKKNKANR